MIVRDIREGETLRIKLEKILRDIARYRLSYRLVSPVVSPELQFRDKIIAFSLSVGEQGFQVRIENLSAHDIKLLWDRAEYSDAGKQTHRIMHAGVRFPDRNNPIPDEIVISRSSFQSTLYPIDRVTYSQQKRAYDVKPLFLLESEAAAGLKGKYLLLFIPVEVNRQIIPYSFKIEITDSVKEIVKG
jgi:hypothetical protein